MTPRRALLGVACLLALAGLAPSAQAARPINVLGVSGEFSDASGNLFSLDGGAAYMGMGSTTTLSFTNTTLNLTEHEKLVIIDGGVVDKSHIVTFRLLSYPADPLGGNPGWFTTIALDSKGNKIGVDRIIRFDGVNWEPNTTGDFWNTSFVTLNMPQISDFTLNFEVPEPSTWALMTVGIGGLGLALRRRRTAAVAV